MCPDKMFRKTRPYQRKSRGFFFHKFPRYNEILCYLRNLTLDFPENVRLERIGSSYQGRPIHMVIVQSDRENPKHGVMIEGGIHAREWLSHTTVLYILEYILNKGRMLDEMDFYIIPCVNPDGYEFTHTNRRLWRKNMNKNGSPKMTHWGVDLNRNFPYRYGLPGSSSQRKSYMYRGKCSLSEPEARSLAKAITKYSDVIKLYISIHCYGNLILYPWGFTKDPISDERDLLECATEAQKAMKRRFPDSRFKVGSLAKAMYLSSGSTIDYTRGIHDIKFSFTMELHKAGKTGFIASTSQIVGVAQETVVGIESMVKYVHNYYSRKRRKSDTCIDSETHEGVTIVGDGDTEVTMQSIPQVPDLAIQDNTLPEEIKETAISTLAVKDRHCVTTYSRIIKLSLILLIRGLIFFIARTSLFRKMCNMFIDLFEMIR